MNRKICRNVPLDTDNRSDTTPGVVIREKGPFWLKEDIRYRASRVAREYRVELHSCNDECALTTVYYAPWYHYRNWLCSRCNW